MSLYTFWVGWEVDDEIPGEHMVSSWPDGMKGWRSGIGEDYTTYTGRVTAGTAREAETISPWSLRRERHKNSHAVGS